MDIAISILALTVLSPVFIAVAAALKIEGQGGSVFYGGKRIGLKNRQFSCWKIRSMEPDSDHLLDAYLEANPGAKKDWEKYRKLPNDPRITTRTARIIRKTSIDELPQLWNVLKGEMSLVGPRPEVRKYVDLYSQEDLIVLSVRPGITDYASIHFRNENELLKDAPDPEQLYINEIMPEKLALNKKYVFEKAYFKDVNILFKTFKVVLNS